MAAVGAGNDRVVRSRHVVVRFGVQIVNVLVFVGIIRSGFVVLVVRRLVVSGLIRKEERQESNRFSR